MDILNHRQVQILKFVAEGLTIKQIGVALGLSHRTVGANLTELYQILGVRNNIQAVVLAIKDKIIDVNDIHLKGKE